MTGLRRYHAAVWDEPLVMELGAPGRRGLVFPQPSRGARPVGDAARSSRRRCGARRRPPARSFRSRTSCATTSTSSQETLGMMGISLFGTCTMKYNPRLGEALAARPELAELHPAPARRDAPGRSRARPRVRRDPPRALRDGPVRLPGRRRRPRRRTRSPASPAPTTPRAASSTGVTRSSRRSRRIPCNAATAAAAGFKVVTLMLGDDGYPPLEALQRRGLRPHRGADGQQPRRHGDLQPAHRRVGADRPRGRRALLLRPRQLQRRHGQDPRPRARLRRVHVHAPQDLRRAEGRRRAGRRRARLHRRAGAVPAGAASSCATASATASTTTGPTASARCASSGAMCRRS